MSSTTIAWLVAIAFASFLVINPQVGLALGAIVIILNVFK